MFSRRPPSRTIWGNTQAVQGKCTLTMTHLPSLLVQRTGGHCLGTFRATGRPTLHDQLTTLSCNARNLPPSDAALRQVLQYQSLKNVTYFQRHILFYHGLFPKFKANIFSETVISKRCSIVIMSSSIFMYISSVPIPVTDDGCHTFRILIAI